MNKKILREGLDYLDLEGQLSPVVTIDEYTAKSGTDDQLITLSFVIKSQKAGEDLSDWFEKGYDFVMDAQVSDGEIKPGRYLLFVEINRRSSSPEKICELLSDLKTLTDYDLNDWTIHINDEDYDADVDVLRQVMILSPQQYRKNKENQEELNEYREIAGLDTKNIYDSSDKDIQNFKNLAGL